MKTAKCAEVARLATEGHSGAITVSTLKEAEYFFEHGFNDITYAVGIVPDKLARVAALQARGARVSVVTDNVDVARAIGVRARALDAKFEVMIELDTGDGRAGLLGGGTGVGAGSCGGIAGDCSGGAEVIAGTWDEIRESNIVAGDADGGVPLLSLDSKCPSQTVVDL